jgi:hypothetical protein
VKYRQKKLSPGDAGLDRTLPGAKSVPAHLPGGREKILRVVSERGLAGFANDTKWNEFIAASASIETAAFILSQELFARPSVRLQSRA